MEPRFSPMAVLITTAKQVHPDEYDHVNAARFYTTHWLRGTTPQDAGLIDLLQDSRASK
jgi:hypothetical protein